jgi:hypothetical protein
MFFLTDDKQLKSIVNTTRGTHTNQRQPLKKTQKRLYPSQTLTVFVLNKKAKNVGNRKRKKKTVYAGKISI